LEIGFAGAQKVGSCAIVAVVKGNKLYVANAGDCEGVVLRRKEDGSFEEIEICRPFTCNSPEEQQRLRAEFPDEKDIVVCRSPDAWYVKGRLMPSRAFGDFALKHAEFNPDNKNPVLGFRRPIANFKGPYISYKPEIRVIDLTKDDAFLILSSDGLWDEVKTTEVGTVIKGMFYYKYDITTHLSLDIIF
jgi:pyruvate dehydrogenase phosphatase